MAYSHSVSYVTRVAAVVALAAMAGLVSPVSSQTPAAAVTVLRDVTMIDGLGNPPRPGTTLVIRDGRIADIIAAGETSPPGAIDLDVAGKYVMPGLIDAHVHLASTDRPRGVLNALMQATLLGGVTSVRDMGGNGALVAELARAAELPGAASPAIFTAAVFAGPEAHWFTDRRAPFFANHGPLAEAPWLVRVDRRTNIRDAVTRAKAFGATGVALDSFLTRSSVGDIANEARRQGLQVWSQSTVIPATPGDVVRARPTTMSHADQLVWQGRAGVPEALFGRPGGIEAAMTAVPPDAGPIRDVLQSMRERGVMLEPTLYIGAQAAGLAGDSDRVRIDRQVAYGAAVTALARETGVWIVAGTDALGGSTPNLHAELQLLVARAGLTPLEAIRAATFNAARAIGQAGELGSIEVGRRANLVVLDRNPADDIRNTQTIVLVVRDGVVHRRVIPMAPGPYGEPPPQDDPS